MLHAALALNPWQTGQEKWYDVAKEMEEKLKINYSVRAIKGRVKLLISKFKKQELKVTTGTEEQRTERGSLLESIISILEEENQLINDEYGANDNVIEQQNINNIDVDENVNDGIGEQNCEDSVLYQIGSKDYLFDFGEVAQILDNANASTSHSLPVCQVIYLKIKNNLNYNFFYIADRTNSTTKSMCTK